MESVQICAMASGTGRAATGSSGGRGYRIAMLYNVMQAAPTWLGLANICHQADELAKKSISYLTLPTRPKLDAFANVCMSLQCFDFFADGVHTRHAKTGKKPP